MKTKFLQIEPVLPSQDIERDINWHSSYLGFEPAHYDNMYAVLRREKLFIHLQWHADSKDDS
ncbi:MAG: hypothetical protein ACNS62_19260 [Candidatus Cyclobacteriaceae bacterium M3_2C_046]